MIKNALFLFFVCAAVFVFYLPSYLKMQALSEKNRSYEKKITDLQVDNARMTAERDRLENDPAYFEKVARKKLGIIRDGEVIYKMVPAGSKKPGGLLSEDEQQLMKKPEAPAAPGKTARGAAGKTSQQKKKNSATMTKSSAPKGSLLTDLDGSKIFAE